MTKEEKIVFLKIGIIGVILSGIGYILSTSIGNGILLGVVCGIFHYVLMNLFLTLSLKINSFKIGLFILYFFGNIGIFALPLYIGCAYPNKVNVFGAAFGLVLHNLYMYISSFMQNFRKER